MNVCLIISKTRRNKEPKHKTGPRENQETNTTKQNKTRQKIITKGGDIVDIIKAYICVL